MFLFVALQDISCSKANLCGMQIQSQKYIMQSRRYKVNLVGKFLNSCDSNSVATTIKMPQQLKGRYHLLSPHKYSSTLKKDTTHKCFFTATTTATNRYYQYYPPPPRRIPPLIV